jgi:hypothetical protein
MVVEVVRGDTVSVAYRALLRNLRLLGGQRLPKVEGGPAPAVRALVTGFDAATVAARLTAMEPSCSFEVAGDSASVDLGACGDEWGAGERCHNRVLPAGHFSSLLVPPHVLPHAQPRSAPSRASAWTA